jgi:hypothetical protein
MKTVVRFGLVTAAGYVCSAAIELACSKLRKKMKAAAVQKKASNKLIEEKGGRLS